MRRGGEGRGGGREKPQSVRVALESSAADVGSANRYVESESVRLKMEASLGVRPYGHSPSDAHACSRGDSKERSRHLNGVTGGVRAPPRPR